MSKKYMEILWGFVVGAAMVGGIMAVSSLLQAVSA